VNHALSRLFQLINCAIAKVSVISQDPQRTGGWDQSEHRLFFFFFIIIFFFLNFNPNRA
jgi:hypothetical protein